MKSREGKVGAQGGTSVSRSKLHSSHWHVPPEEPNDLTRIPVAYLPSQMGAGVGLGNDPGCGLGEPFLPRRPGPLPGLRWQQVGCPGCQRGHQDRQALRAGPRSFCPPLPPQLVTCQPLKGPSRCSTPSAYSQTSAPRKGNAAPQKWFFPRPSWKRCCLSCWSS